MTPDFDPTNGDPKPDPSLTVTIYRRQFTIKEHQFANLASEYYGHAMETAGGADQFEATFQSADHAEGFKLALESFVVPTDGT